MAGGPRLAVEGGLSFLSSLRCGILLRKTGTLEGPQQPNWCLYS
ncbi:hypothetical protein [Adhaeribacter radiodurans]|nr:hypothetical protein [Adhaeribacter radiodurans]